MDKQNLIKTNWESEFTINGVEISCAVLERPNDEATRVLVERSVANALGVKGAGAYWKNKPKSTGEIILPEYISAKYLAPYISPELREKLANPIEYISKNGKKALGREATILPDICDVWIKAREDNALNDEQRKIADRAYILLRGIANVGINALVDEATGYQEVRDRKALQKILDKFLNPYFAKWAKTFPDEFYQEIFRLNNWTYDEWSKKRPALVGKYTKDIIYKRLAPGVLKELEKLNPKNEKGNRPRRHFQFLTVDMGHPALQNLLYGEMALMKASSNWRKFMSVLNRVYPKFGHTLPLGFDEDIE